MKNKIVSTICVLTVATILLSSSFYFVRAEDGITNDSSENKVNTLSLNEQKEQVQEELTKAEEQLEYVQSEYDLKNRSFVRMKMLKKQNKN